MSDKRATRRAKRQGQSRPKSRMQALDDNLYINKQKSQNTFLFLYGACLIWDSFAPAASHAASPVYRSFNHCVLIIAQPRFACRTARSPPFILNRSSILA